MPPLTPYTRNYSFTDFQAGNPSAPLPGIQVDNELENVEQSLGQAIDAIKDVRRSDGALKNSIVTVDSLSPAVAAGVGTGALASAEAAAASAIVAQTARDFASEWASEATGADVNDGVNPVGKSAYYWSQVALGAATGALPDGSVSTAKLANGALSADVAGRAKMADGFVNTAKLASEVTDAIDAKASAAYGVPIGSLGLFAMNSAPTGWLKANGAAVSRTTYAALFSKIGTAFGAGDGSTTFNLPDLRGEFVRGWADDRAVDTGRGFGSAQSDLFKSHTHAFGFNVGAPGSTTNGGSQYNSAASTFSDLTSATGGSETRPRNIALLYCVKY